MPTQTALTGSVGVGGTTLVTLGDTGGATGTSGGATTTGVDVTLPNVGSAAGDLVTGVVSTLSDITTSPALQVNLMAPIGGGLDLNTTVGGPGTTTPIIDPANMPSVATAYVDIFRLPDASDIPAPMQAQLNQLQTEVNDGQMTDRQAILHIADAAAGYTSVAETMYDFFTGLTPTADGLTYLEGAGSTNPNGLADNYYAGFDLENRYINFASNLGLYSDYAPHFAQDFGSLTFNQTVETAYDRIIGVAEATAEGLNPQAAIADIESRASYFSQVATERFGNANHDLATKLAVIGYIMEEAVKADAGHYGTANQAFLVQLAEGNAQFHVNLVGAYGSALDATT